MFLLKVVDTSCSNDTLPKIFMMAMGSVYAVKQFKKCVGISCWGACFKHVIHIQEGKYQ